MTAAQMGWAFAAAALLALEIVIPGSLICIWFMLGAVAALLVSIICPVFWVQMLVFLAVSILTLVLTRPLVAQKIKQKFVPTNADQVLGKTATVIVAIAPGKKGRVRVDGLDWAAAAETPLAVGQSCTVQSMAGATLHVTAVCGADLQTQDKKEETV